MMWKIIRWLREDIGLGLRPKCQFIISDRIVADVLRGVADGAFGNKEAIARLIAAGIEEQSARGIVRDFKVYSMVLMGKDIKPTVVWRDR